jgi:GTPase SAR1 family protein
VDLTSNFVSTSLRENVEAQFNNVRFDCSQDERMREFSVSWSDHFDFSGCSELFESPAFTVVGSCGQRKGAHIKVGDAFEALEDDQKSARFDKWVGQEALWGLYAEGYGDSYHIRDESVRFDYRFLRCAHLRTYDRHWSEDYRHVEFSERCQQLHEKLRFPPARGDVRSVSWPRRLFAALLSSGYEPDKCWAQLGPSCGGNLLSSCPSLQLLADLSTNMKASFAACGTLRCLIVSGANLLCCPSEDVSSLGGLCALTSFQCDGRSARTWGGSDFFEVTDLSSASLMFLSRSTKLDRLNLFNVGSLNLFGCHLNNLSHLHLTGFDGFLDDLINGGQGFPLLMSLKLSGSIKRVPLRTHSVALLARMTNLTTLRLHGMCGDLMSDVLSSIPSLSLLTSLKLTCSSGEEGTLGTGLADAVSTLTLTPRLVVLQKEYWREAPPLVVKAFCRRWSEMLAGGGEVGDSVSRVKLRSPQLSSVLSDSLPSELQSAPNDDVIRYFRLIGAKAQRKRRVKVVVLGEGGEGKTTLVRRLTSGRFAPNVAQTDGVEVTAHERRYDMEFNFYDFGGQEVYEISHPLFFTQDVALMVVFDARRLTDADTIFETVKKWVTSFTQEVGEAFCQVAFVGTKWDGRSAVDLRLQLARGDLAHVRGKLGGTGVKLEILFVNSDTGAGTEEVWRWLEGVAANRRGEVVPEVVEEVGRWAREHSAHGFYRLEEVYGAFERFGRGDVEFGLRFCHRGGVVLWYEGDGDRGGVGSLGSVVTRGIVFVNPQALTDAVAELVTSQAKLDAEERGVFQRKDALRALRSKFGSDVVAEVVLALMAKNYILFEVEATRQLLVPGMLQRDAPADVKRKLEAATLGLGVRMGGGEMTRCVWNRCVAAVGYTSEEIWSGGFEMEFKKGEQENVKVWCVRCGEGLRVVGDAGQKNCVWALKKLLMRLLDVIGERRGMTYQLEYVFGKGVALGRGKPYEGDELLEELKDDANAAVKLGGGARLGVQEVVLAPWEEELRKYFIPGSHTGLQELQEAVAADAEIINKLKQLVTEGPSGVKDIRPRRFWALQGCATGFRWVWERQIKDRCNSHLLARYWEVDTHWPLTDGQKEMKRRTLEQFDSYSQVFKNLGAAGTRGVRVFHGTSFEALEGIAAHGLRDLRRPSDVGWFGAGVYGTMDPSYAMMYASGAMNGGLPNERPVVLVGWCAASMVYPITRDADYRNVTITSDDGIPTKVDVCAYFDAEGRRGTALRSGHDAHIVFVKKGSWQVPHGDDFDNVYTEIVTSSQNLLPLFAVEF